MERGWLNISGVIALPFPTRIVDGRRRDCALVERTMQIKPPSALRSAPEQQTSKPGRFRGKFATQGLRDLSNEIDQQETVALIRSIHPDMIGKLEPMFKRTARNAAMQVALGGRLLLLAADSQKVGVEGDLEIILGKASRCNRNPVAVVARPKLPSLLQPPFANAVGIGYPTPNIGVTTRRSDKVAVVEAKNTLSKPQRSIRLPKRSRRHVQAVPGSSRAMPAWPQLSFRRDQQVIQETCRGRSRNCHAAPWPDLATRRQPVQRDASLATVCLRESLPRLRTARSTPSRRRATGFLCLQSATVLPTPRGLPNSTRD